MATYKKGFKKQNTETILLKIIIGIIVGVFAFVVIAFVYDTTTQWKTYDYFTAVTEYDGILEYTNGGDTALTDYVLYFYSDTCDSCKEVKNTILRDAKNINGDEEMFFVVNIDNMTDGDTYLSDFLDSVDQTKLSTPMTVVVADGEFYASYVGSPDCVDVIDTIAHGDFEPFNN